MTDMQGKNILITGAAGGIGNALARQLHKRGANLFLTDREGVDLRTFSAHSDSGFIVSLAVDLSSPTFANELYSAVSEKNEPLDGFVNVAGVIQRRGSINEVTIEDFDLQYVVNLRAPFFLIQALSPLLRDGASVILFSSQGWWTGGLGGSLPYAAMKAGVVSMTRGLARELAPRRIRVNAVAPGFVDTQMMHEGLTQEKHQELIDQVPLGRLATPEEVAESTALLLTSATGYMTGTIMNISGGQLVY